MSSNVGVNVAILSFTRDCLECNFEEIKKEIAAIMQLSSFDEMLAQLIPYENASSMKKVIDILLAGTECVIHYSTVESTRVWIKCVPIT